MKTLLITCLLSVSALAQEANPSRAVDAPGDDISKYTLIISAKGREYHDVTITNATAGTIKLLHRDGIATLSLAEMPAVIQKRFLFDPSAAAFEAVTMANEKQQAAAEAAKRQEENAALQQQQAAESIAISAIEKKGWMAEMQVIEKKTDGCLCRVWELRNEVVKGQATHSGKPVTRLVKDAEHRAFVIGLDMGSGQTIQAKIMPVSVKRDGDQCYAMTGSAAYRAERQEIEAKRAQQEARAKASREAAAARAAARAQAAR